MTSLRDQARAAAIKQREEARDRAVAAEQARVEKLKLKVAKDFPEVKAEYVGKHPVDRLEYARHGDVVKTVDEDIIDLDGIEVIPTVDSNRYVVLGNDSDEGRYVPDSYYCSVYTNRLNESLVTTLGRALRNLGEHPAKVLRERGSRCGTCGRGW